MKKATEVKPQSHTYSFTQIKKAAILYMALPLLCYLIGFLRWYFAIISCAALIFVLWKTLKGNEDRTPDLHQKDPSQFLIPLKTVLLVFLFSLIWSYLGGMNGYFYQSTDWDCRNAVYFDLIRYDWPIIYEQNGAALVYYVGHWLPPATIAKLIQNLTGSIEAGRFIGRMLLWFWSSAGLTIIILMIYRVVGAQTAKARIAATLIFVFFSGMDIIGALIRNTTGDVFAPDHLHLEWWMRGFQYTSIMACLFWVFNQAIIPWMITLCFLTDENPRNYVFYATSCLLCGTLPCFGLVMLMLVKAVTFIIQKRKQKETDRILPGIFSAQNLVTFLVIFPMITAYLLSANTFRDVFGDRLPLFGNRTMVEEAIQTPGELSNEKIQGLTETEEDTKTTEENRENKDENTVMNAPAPEQPKYKVFFIPYSILGLFLFVGLEVGIYMLLIWTDHRKDPLFYAIGVFFFIIPFIHIGRSYDFCMRASIPSLFILMLYVNRFLLEHFPRKTGSTQKRFHSKEEKNKRILAICLAVCLAFGAVTPIVEIYRGIQHVIESKTIFLENQNLMTFNVDWIQNSYECSNPKEHFFFRYLAG